MPRMRRVTPLGCNVLTAFFLCGSCALAAERVSDPTLALLKTMSFEELMELRVTSVNRQEDTLGRATAAVSVITQEDIRRSGVTVIPELFRRVPGMDVARIDANKWAISARGFNDRFANKLLVQA